MLKNFLKQTFRQIFRYRLSSIINLFGLSVGMACCVVIFLFVNSELKFDEYHKDSDRIYQVTTTETNDNSEREYAHSYLPYTVLLESQMPEIESSVRMLKQSISVANKDKNIILQEDQFFYVDPTFFDVFTVPLKYGNISTALSQPNNIVISEKTALKYFGKTNAIGQTLIVEQDLMLTVSAVFAELPNQSSIQFEMIAPMSLTKEVFGPWIEDLNKTWYYPQVYSFVKLAAGEPITKIESQLASFEKAFLPPYITDVRSQELLPLEEVHFSNLENEIHPTIKKNILFTFAASGIVILLIAGFNFINLFLSRIVLRIKDVGVQKVMGASGYNIWQQTFVDSLVYLGLSLFLALGWVFLFLPVFNNLMETDLGLFKPNTLEAWLTVFLIILALSLMISFVPSLFLSRFSLTSSLKGLKQSTKKRKSAFSLQSTLVVFQFSIAVVLIISTIVMQSQMSFIKSKNLGLNTEQVVVLPVRDESVQNNFSTLKNQLLQNNTITNVSAISNFPWSKGYYDFQTLITHSGNEIKANAYTLLVDEDFVQTMGMNMVFGRSFSREFGTDSTAFIMNETAARLYEIDDQEAVTIEMAQIGSRQPKKGQLIGIVEDFHLQSLHNKVEPLIITLAPESYFTDNIIVKFSSLDVTNTLNSIASDLQKIAPDRPFEYFFLDEAFAQLYQKETRISFLFNYFSILAIVIACLGLLGMVAFATSQRIKEIGIRKVLGATVSSIVKLITMSFIKLVIIAVLIAVPVAYLFMSNWLESFSYRTTLSWWMFLAAGCIALIIALIAIGYQSLRSAIANPVNALRSE